jgi:N6-L-threonylcarbamoyladenine synthase
LIIHFIDIPPDGLIPNIDNLCASFQLVLTRHLCHRVQRGMTYANRQELIPKDKQTLVKWLMKNRLSKLC